MLKNRKIFFAQFSLLVFGIGTFQLGIANTNNDKGLGLLSSNCKTTLRKNDQTGATLRKFNITPDTKLDPILLTFSQFSITNHKLGATFFVVESSLLQSSLIQQISRKLSSAGINSYNFSDEKPESRNELANSLKSDRNWTRRYSLIWISPNAFSKLIAKGDPNNDLQGLVREIVYIHVKSEFSEKLIDSMNEFFGKYKQTPTRIVDMTIQDGKPESRTSKELAPEKMKEIADLFNEIAAREAKKVKPVIVKSLDSNRPKIISPNQKPFLYLVHFDEVNRLAEELDPENLRIEILKNFSLNNWFSRIKNNDPIYLRVHWLNIFDSNVRNKLIEAYSDIIPPEDVEFAKTLPDEAMPLTEALPEKSYIRKHLLNEEAKK